MGDARRSASAAHRHAGGVGNDRKVRCRAFANGPGSSLAEVGLAPRLFYAHFRSRWLSRQYIGTSRAYSCMEIRTMRNWTFTALLFVALTPFPGLTAVRHRPLITRISSRAR